MSGHNIFSYARPAVGEIGATGAPSNEKNRDTLFPRERHRERWLEQSLGNHEEEEERCKVTDFLYLDLCRGQIFYYFFLNHCAHQAWLPCNLHNQQQAAGAQTYWICRTAPRKVLTLLALIVLRCLWFSETQRVCENRMVLWEQRTVISVENYILNYSLNSFKVKKCSVQGKMWSFGVCVQCEVWGYRR